MRSWLLFLLCSSLFVVGTPGCGDDDDDDDDSGDGDADTDADGDADPPGAFGEPCEADEDCADGVCFEDACSRPCETYGDCPNGSLCGMGGERVICVPEAPADDNVGARCMNDEDACEGGNECRTRGPDDVYAYCSNSCESDRDCPAKWFCAVGPADPDNEYCQPREYCDPCNVDDDCRTEYDDCIEGEDGLKFCSYVCDPDPSSSSCPTDSECREVAGHGFQCVPFAGGCTGDGSLCQPCRFDSDCEDGPCLYDRYAQIRLCGQDCDRDPCPLGYDCVPMEGHDKPQCYPRVLVAGRAQTQACTRPSGGGQTCDPCADFSDCESGQCIQFGTGNYCGADCTDTDCGAWEECQAFQNGAFHLCVPYNEITCGQYYRCTQDCDPDTDECDAGACS